MKKRKSRSYLLYLIILIYILILSITYTRYSQLFSRTITLNVRKPNYTVKFYSNKDDGNEDEVTPQQFVYGTKQNLSKNTYTNGNYYFKGWNTERDGTGTSYIDEQEVDKLSSVDGDEINLYAQWTYGVAEIDGTYYTTLQAAVNAVPTNNTETTVRLLTNTSENIVINKNKNIIFDFGNHTLSDPSNGIVIENRGTIKILNGTIESTSLSAATINNEDTGKLTISGGRVMMIASGGKQAIYNKAKGIVEITSDAYISTVSSIRAAVQNMSGGFLTITGGTIVSPNFHAVDNAGTMTIGEKDGNVNKQSPSFQGATYGVSSSANFKFYDGIMKGKTKGINDETKVQDKETGYGIANSEEEIGGVTYKTAYLAITNIVTFNANQGTVSEATRAIENGGKIGTLPIPSRDGYLFDGWFTSSEEGEQITKDTIITSDVTYFAHWTKTTTAEIDGTEYNTLQAAVSAVPTNNTQTTVKLLRNTNENITVAKNQNIVFNLQNYTIRNKTNNTAVIINNGKVAISNGTITSNAEGATIDNNETGELIISGGEILSTGTRSAIYNLGGKVDITGNAYLSSTATGTPTTSSLERGTVHNLKNGTVTITGGTIIGVNQQAVSSEATLILGIKEDGNVDSTSPIIRGKTYGIRSTKTFKFYDGIVKGIQDAIDGTITEQEPDTQIVNSTESIEGTTYKTNYLEENE